MPCPTGKQQYATAAAASRVKSASDKRHGKGKAGGWHKGPAMVYRCRECGQWHIGHTVAPLRNARPRYEPVCDWSAAL